MDIRRIQESYHISNSGLKVFDSVEEAILQGYTIYDLCSDADERFILMRIYVHERWAFALAKKTKHNFNGS